MIAPAALVMLTPLVAGTFFGVEAVFDILTGGLVSGVQLAISMSNSGGAWDNAKKYISGGFDPDPALRKKYGNGNSTPAHDAAVTGDTVGDPFKDTSGPALNILMKLMSVLSLTCASIFKNDWETWYSGVIVLVVEMLFCCVVFYFVWYKDNTMDVLTAAAGAKSAADAGETAGTSTEMKQGDASIVHNV